MTDFSSSSHNKKAAWLRLVVYSALSWFVLGIAIPWVYDVVPVMRYSRDQQQKYGIEAGAIYYTDVPVTLDAEMASRKAVQEAIARRAASM